MVDTAVDKRAPEGWSHPQSPFHAGEESVQKYLGVRDKMEMVGRKLIRSFMPDQHREFYAQLPFMFIGAVDSSGQPWASILVGPPGFVSSPDSRTLTIAARPFANNPLYAAIKSGADIGLLGLELTTRRRNRVNGKIAHVTEEGFCVDVTQSFGNCAKYIQMRKPALVSDFSYPPEPEGAIHGETLSSADYKLIIKADTFFIASTSCNASGPSAGADVSHRGGKPGFVRIDDKRTLTTPDFVGNAYYNTIGNMTNEPRVGLLFIDWDNGDLVYLATRGEIIWDGPEVDAFAGARRVVRFHVERTIRLKSAMPLRWTTPEPSPFLGKTGTW